MATPPTGRPRGRPKGSISKRRREIRDLIELAAPELVEKLIEQAREGDTQAAVALLDRTAPRIKPVGQTYQIDLSGGQAEVIGNLLEAVGRGDMPPDDALTIARMTDALPDAIQHEPIDYEKLDAIYEKAMAKAEEDRVRIQHERAHLFEKAAQLDADG
ncbi:MAG: hypothetical protein K9L88_07720 [Chromatiaceae bacterium]|nr:hypothetical protein [Chromatiaceae bacterium]